MRVIRILSSWVAATLLLAACGGSDPEVPGSGSPSGAPTTPGTFTAIVSFGDSLSDIGSYAPATSLAGDGSAPYFGGRFTTNDTSTGAPTATPLGKVWVENLAASLGIVVTPAEVGFAGTSVQCPAAAVPALATTCTAYGQGGARITHPDGIGKDDRRPDRAAGDAGGQPPRPLRLVHEQRPDPGVRRQQRRPHPLRRLRRHRRRRSRPMRRPA